MKTKRQFNYKSVKNMNNTLKGIAQNIRLFLLVGIMVFSHNLYAQSDYGNSIFRENGLIWVVVGVLIIITVGLFVYLFVIDKKISKFEAKLNKDNEYGSEH